MMQLHIAGRLVRDPETKTSQHGRTYLQALLSVPQRDGDTLATVMVFDAALQTLVAALQKGESLSVLGAGSVRAYLDKDGQPNPALTVIATRLMGLVEAAAAPPVKAGDAAGKAPPKPKPRPAAAARDVEFSDPVPF